MAELIAYYQGSTEPKGRWPLSIDLQQVLGRETDLSPVWDPLISRKQANLRWNGSVLEVRRYPDSQGVMWYQGRRDDHFKVDPGQRFTIGRTEFELVGDPISSEPPDVDDAEPSDEEMKSFPGGTVFSDPGPRLDILSRLPEAVTDSKEDYHHRLLDLIWEGLSNAVSVLLVVQSKDADGRAGAPVVRSCRGQPLHRPSSRLIQKALDRQRTFLFERDPSNPKSSINHNNSGDSKFSVTPEMQWAFCTPLLGEFGGGGAFYAEGKTPLGPNFKSWDPSEDVKFVELIASYAVALRQNSLLSRRQAVLGQFFSPKVFDRFSIADAEKALEPQETQVTVLFCDLRGFSRVSEEQADNLRDLLTRVSKALGVTTGHILKQGGLIGDFQGDSAMGFWGWPIAMPATDAAAACRAALAIRDEMDRVSTTPDGPLGDFKMGVGIATGRAIAGRIGTDHQSKVTVFGPVVNLASRLEGMTKILGVPVLLDEATADIAGAHLKPDGVRFRQIATVRPAGLANALPVFEALPPDGTPGTPGNDSLECYRKALKLFEAGDHWLEALTLLDRIRANDPAAEYLFEYISDLGNRPPIDWSGVIAMKSKGK